MPNNHDLDPILYEYIEKVLQVASSRAQFIIRAILKNRFITSEEIRNAGYVHGARAIGDVRDNGIPLVTLSTKSSDNRSIGKYVFGEAADIKKHKFGGRINLPKKLKTELIKKQGLTCSISKCDLPENELQIDHRVPYYISGDVAGERNPDDFMLLSKSMQRAKSWACEHCENLLKTFKKEICKECYWASPDSYEHIAMKNERRADIVFFEEEIPIFEAVKRESLNQNSSVQSVIKSCLSHHFKK